MNSILMLASVISLVFYLLLAGAHGASFIIELKNGREVTTSHVWEETDEIKFYTPHGTAGVSKALVKSIKPSTPIYSNKISRNSISSSASEARISPKDKGSQTNTFSETQIRQSVENSELSQEQKTDGDKSVKAGDTESYHAKKQMLMSELDAATHRYLEASGARNLEAKRAALDDMRAYSKRILDLGDEVKSKNGGVLPAWWNE
jgi:hypothetical protein